MKIISNNVDLSRMVERLEGGVVGDDYKVVEELKKGVLNYNDRKG